MNTVAERVKQTIVHRVKRTIVRSLGLEIDPEELADDEVLFGSGLGADSEATLGVVFALEAEFGIEVEDEELRVELFATIQSLVDYVEGKLRVPNRMGFVGPSASEGRSGKAPEAGVSNHRYAE